MMTSPRLLLSGVVLAALVATGCSTLPAWGPAVQNQLTSAGALGARGIEGKPAPAGYYDAATGKQGQGLLTALNQAVSKHKDLGYSGARQVMFKDVDDLDNDDVVTCIYIGRSLSKITSTEDAYQGGAGLNAEHTWPQSKGAEGVAKSDLHHLFPADCKANSKRGSFPFDVVAQASWSEGGSKFGVNAKGAQVFEPRDQQKGDTARALLYFYTVYGIGGNRIDTSNFKIEEETLKRWHQQDPVDANERLRNDAIFTAQGNRNPFVDHPEYVEAVGRFLN